MPGVLIKGGNLDTQRDIRDACRQTKDHVRTQEEGDNLQVKEKGFRRTY